MDSDTRERVRALVLKAANALQTGADMRQAQRAYFKTRSTDSLMASKALERAFDNAAAEALHECKTLLDWNVL